MDPILNFDIKVFTHELDEVHAIEVYAPATAIPRLLLDRAGLHTDVTDCPRIASRREVPEYLLCLPPLAGGRQRGDIYRTARPGPVELSNHGREKSPDGIPDYPILVHLHLGKSPGVD